MLQTIHGKGTFLATDIKHIPCKTNQVVGAVLLHNSWFEAMERLRGKYLDEGWFVASYCASQDCQNPKAEARFLKHAMEQNFAAVILVGSPLAPLNTELYAKMRRAGMKVVHLTHYKYDMSGETAVLPDYCAAGMLACSAAATHGNRNILFLDIEPVTSPSSRLRREGMNEMAGRLKLNRLKDITFAYHRDRIAASGLDKIRLSLEKLPPHTAVLCDSSVPLYELKTYWDRTAFPESKRPFMLAMSGTCPEAAHVNHISFDYEDSIRLAMDYVRDDGIPPPALFHKSIAPELFIIPVKKSAAPEIIL